MVQEAEANKEADAKRKETVESRNQADAVVHQTRKTIEEAGDKLTADVKEPIEKLVNELEVLSKNDNSTKAEIDAKIAEINALSQKLTEAIGGAGAKAGGQNAKKDDDDIIDVEDIVEEPKK
jgi:molecular chaperone DnaK